MRRIPDGQMAQFFVMCLYKPLRGRYGGKEKKNEILFALFPLSSVTFPQRCRCRCRCRRVSEKAKCSKNGNVRQTLLSHLRRVQTVVWVHRCLCMCLRTSCSTHERQRKANALQHEIQHSTSEYSSFKKKGAEVKNRPQLCV